MTQTKTPRILSGDQICLFCGEPMTVDYDHGDPYFECDCPDAKTYRQIESEIAALKAKLPKPKFTIEQKSVLYLVREH